MAVNILFRLGEFQASVARIPRGSSLVQSGGGLLPDEQKVNPSEKVDGNLIDHAGFVAGPLQKSLKIARFANETLAAPSRLGTVEWYAALMFCNASREGNAPQAPSTTGPV